MKIKTITCHDVYNFGASLQAYALMKYLKDIGNEVEIVDYKPAYLKFDLWAIGPKWKRNILLKILYFSYVVPKRLCMKKRRSKFDLFTRQKLRTTNRTYSSFHELKKDPPLADIFFAGSDQIWNTELPNGKDPSFYLDFVKANSIKASYAASFSVSKINPEIRNFVREKLQGLDYISVREETGIEILKNLGFENGRVVIDPVFLLGKIEWETLAVSPTNDQKYIFVYDQENNPLIKKYALKIAKKYDMKIFAVESLYPMLYADRKIRYASPEDFIGLVMNCEICLTNSFHCMAFSLIFNKKFYLFKRTQKVNSRMTDLLKYLNLTNRIADGDYEMIQLTEIEYSKVNELIDRKKAYSITYLEEVIEKAKCQKVRQKQK